MAVWKKVIVSGSQAELARLRVDSDNGIVIGSSSITSRGILDVAYDGQGQYFGTINIGADPGAVEKRTNNVGKQATLTAPPYTSTRSNISLLAYSASADGAEAVLVIGGNNTVGAHDAPTLIRFGTTTSVDQTGNVGSTKMFINGTGQVGIGFPEGTTVGPATFAVKGRTVNVAEFQSPTGDIRIAFSGSNDTYLSSTDQGGIALGDSATFTNQTLIVTQSRVGINKATPVYALDIIGAASASLGFIGSLTGTASWANNVISASHAVTASHAFNAISSSYSDTAVSASYASASTSASYAGTSSYSIFTNLGPGLNFDNEYSALIGGIYSPVTSFGNPQQYLSMSYNPVKNRLWVGNVTASSFTGSLSGSVAGTASWAFSASNAISASTATTATQVLNALTFGVGLSGSNSTYNGSTAVTLHLSGAAALSTNVLTKWGGTGLVNTNITDTGTQVQIGAGASSGLTVAAGGVNVTGNSLFNNNVTIQGDLTVAGTASFVNADNLRIRDQFISINSGSNTLRDSGWVSMYNSDGSGSAFYLDAGSTGTYGRFAVAYNVAGTATSVTPDEFVVTVKTDNASAPSAVPTWGGSDNGEGNMWITTGGDIYIYA